MSSDLDEAKQRLLDKLGPCYGVYIQLIGKWFRGQISKEEFDKSAKRLVDRNFVNEHNKFWLAFFHHCANSTSRPLSQGFNLQNVLGKNYDQKSSDSMHGSTSGDYSAKQTEEGSKFFNDSANVKFLPDRVITHMRIFVIAWELGLDSASNHVSHYIELALKHFLKNIITEIICSKTAFRLRENRFKHAIGVKPINPYLNNSLKIYTNHLEYDPYQIASNRMNSSLIDTYVYNDSLFPSRLHETQALYEYACSTTAEPHPAAKKLKRFQLSEIFLDRDKKLTLQHMLIAFLTNKAIIPSQTLYSINLERIFTKLSKQYTS